MEQEVREHLMGLALDEKIEHSKFIIKQAISRISCEKLFI